MYFVVFCIDFLVYSDTVISYKSVFTNDRHQSTPANLSYSCILNAHIL